MADKYVLRRTVLKALAPIDEAPMTVRDLARTPSFAMRMDRGLLTMQQLAELCAGLAENGYIIDMRPGREPLYRITAAGRAQHDRETDLEEYVWGEYASEFAS